MVPLERQLLYKGESVPISSKAFDTLLLLIQRRGHLVQKSEIMDTIWADSFVEEHNLVVTISMLRKLLLKGDRGRSIETVAKQGYRFVGKVSEFAPAEPQLEAALLRPAVEPELDATLVGPQLEPESAPNPKSRILTLFAVVGFLLVCLSVSIIFGRFSKQIAPQGRIHSLAVLPFRTVNADEAHAYLSFGLADAIIAKLSSTGEIIVRPTSAVLKYVDSAENPLIVGREQKVDAVLAGSVETLSEKIRVTVRLIRVGDGSSIGEETFEESTQQVLEVENRVAERVSQSMFAHIPGTPPTSPTRREAANSKAYELYLKGRYLWNTRTEEGLRRSIEYFQQATIEDPQYAQAYAGLAESYVLLASYGVESPQKAYVPARGAALNALRLDNSLAEAHASLGMIAFYYGWNWAESEQEFQQAIALNPNEVTAATWYGLNLAATGRLTEAMDLVQRTKEIDPLSPEVNVVLGHLFYSSRQYEKAINTYRQVIEWNPNFVRAHVRLGMVYMVQHAFGDSIHEFEEARRLSAHDPYVDGLLGCAEGLSGNTLMAHKLLEGLMLRSHDQYVPAFSIALLHIGLGDRDRALEWLEKAYQDRSAYLVYAKTDPLLDPLRSDPRFISLLHRMGFI